MKDIKTQIETLQLQAKTILNDTTVSIDDRILDVADIYRQAETLAEENGLDDKHLESLFSDSAKFSYDYGLYKEALPRYTHLITLRESLYGPEDPITASAYHGIGDVYRVLCEFSSALDYQTKALEIRKNVLGEYHLATAESYNDIGLVYVFQGDYEHASEYIHKAKAVREKIIDDNHPDMAESYANIGLVDTQIEKYTDALENYQKALDIYQRAFGSDDRKTGVAYYGVGFSYYQLDDNSNALDYSLKATAIYEKTLGVNHPETAVVYLGLGYVYDGNGESSKALEYFEKANEVFEKAFGQDHLHTAASYTALGAIKCRTGEFKEAIDLCEKGLNITEKILGFISPYTAEVYMGVGALYQLLSEDVRAYEFYLNALEVFKQCPSSEFVDKKIKEIEAEMVKIADKDDKTTVGTRDLFLETLTKIGCQYEFGDEEENPTIYFAYQGENFTVYASNDNNYVRIWDTHWAHVELYDVDDFARLKKVINGSNLNNSVTTVYTIDEAGSNVDVHCRSIILFVPQIPDLQAYLRVELNDFFAAHRYVGIEMEKLRGQEASSNDDEEGRGN